MDFPVEDYKKMLATRHDAAKQFGMASMEPWPVVNAARLMAIVQVFGNNEGFTLSPKFNADREYIQETYGLNGGGRPDPLIVEHIRMWVFRYEAVKDKKDHEFVGAEKWIKEMYGFQLYC